MNHIAQQRTAPAVKPGHLLILCCLFGLILLTTQNLQANIWDQAATVATLALGIILQALPFILIGVLAASLIRFAISEELIARLHPAAGMRAVLAGALLGLIFPVCDCGVLPVARGLLRKGVSMHTVLAYLLTAPVINPVVIMATALAFQWRWNLVIVRLAGTFAVGATIAYLAGYLFDSRDFTGHGAHERHHLEETADAGATLHQIFLHAGNEFFEVGRYLFISAFLAAGIQIWAPKGALLTVAGVPLLAPVATMILAIAMSLCSEADAFVARSLANQFPLGSIMAFMVIGQIMDMRNIMLFTRNFRLSLFLFIAILSLGLTYLLSLSIDLGWWTQLARFSLHFLVHPIG
ncbi:MAG: permease [Thermacetogeniaceae bacterium]